MRGRDIRAAAGLICYSWASISFVRAGYEDTTSQQSAFVPYLLTV